jgi:hypothetical protein
VCGRRPPASRKARFYVRKRPGVGNFSEQNWGISVSAVSATNYVDWRYHQALLATLSA